MITINQKMKYVKKVIYSTKTEEHLNLIINWIESLNLSNGQEFSSYFNRIDLLNTINEMKEYLKLKGEIKNV